MSFASILNMCILFLIDGTFKTNIHLEKPYHLLTNTWKHGGSMLGTEVASGPQSQWTPKICLISSLMFSGSTTIALIIMDNYMQLFVPK